MATSNMKVSTNDYHCTQGSFNSEGITRTSEVDLNAKCGHLSSYELKRAGSCKPELKPEWVQSKDATKRKRVRLVACSFVAHFASPFSIRQYVLSSEVMWLSILVYALCRLRGIV